jgi:Uma2 family endonuclease
MTPPPPAEKKRMTAEEFLAWERDQPEKHEYLDGEVFAMAGGTPRHSALGLAVGAELRAALRGGTCRVMSSDQKVLGRSARHFVYPDVTVVCGGLRLVPGTTDVVANPTVIVEVLSEGTAAYDRGEKWSGYQALETLEDYLLVSQSAVRVEHFQRGEGGAWRYRAAGAGERVTLKNGASLELDAVFAGVFELPGEDWHPGGVVRERG